MKKVTKFSLAAMAVLGLSSGAYAATSIDAGIGGTFTTANTTDTLTVTASGGTTINSDVALNGELTNADDIIINADAGPGGSGGYGGVILQKDSSTLAKFDENGDGGTQIYTTTTMYDDLDMDGNQIHGVAAGTSGMDAVNLNQLNNLEDDMSKGIASTTAIANIPQVEAGKKAAIGLGYGHYNGENAIAAGASWHFGAQSDGIMKVSVGTGGSGETAVGAGASWSW
ncbi:MAG: YadA-like family protein [Sulfurovaceae bacterium]|nr:YadA-like family protein [Sulfurovaceae bacterium]